MSGKRKLIWGWMSVFLLSSGTIGLGQDTVAQNTIGQDPAAQEKTVESVFRVGFAKRDITPTEPVPMWGYGARHDALSEGIMDPLLAKAIVIDTGQEKLALVGLDLGRGPTTQMMVKIRKTVSEQAGVTTVLISGSHTHHGPVIELKNKEGAGKGKFDAAVAYAEKLPDLLSEAIVEAAKKAVPARMGIGVRRLDKDPYNRNRHTKRTPKPIDPTLTVLRFDDEAGKPIAILTNFAAHPTSIPAEVLKFSADYPGHMQRRVEERLKTNCAFIQGAAGDLSANRKGSRGTVEAFGKALGDRVVEIARKIKTKKPENPSIRAKWETFSFKSRVDFRNPLIHMLFSRAFFPELTKSMLPELIKGIDCEMTTVLLNGTIALVGVPGEFFCNHANRFRERVYAEGVMFFGYCNGHCMYFPTIEATSEGGYGAAATVSFAEIGAGERMMNKALYNVYDLMGKYDKEKSGALPTK